MPSLRELIRNTWCKKQSYPGNRNLLCLFVVGRTSSAFSSDMLKEAKKYGDIKLTPFVEDVGNSSLKLIAAFKWIKTNCPDVKYVMRTQDDVIVNMDKLMNSLLISAPSSGFMMGKCREEIPNRNPYSRYYVPLDIYPGEKYPPVCSNMGYIMSVDVVNMIYQESSKQVMIPLDDVFIGVIMESRKMVPQSMDKLIHTKSIGPTARTRYKICSHFIIHIHVNTEESAREIWQVMRDKCNGS
uniref:Hexosyltransferase n=1 Tax=Ciona savignyi TaxID=51511 RepID=H2ZB05_CIOSA